MKYLILDFCDRLKTFRLGEELKPEVFTPSLCKQYKDIRERYGVDGGLSLSDFVHAFFPKSGETDVAVMIPALQRDVLAVSGNGLVPNVFLRALSCRKFPDFLLDGCELYLCADAVRAAGGYTLKIKGPEILEDRATRAGEAALHAGIFCNFSQTVTNLLKTDLMRVMNRAVRYFDVKKYTSHYEVSPSVVKAA